MAPNATTSHSGVDVDIRIDQTLGIQFKRPRPPFEPVDYRQLTDFTDPSPRAARKRREREKWGRQRGQGGYAAARGKKGKR